MKLRYLLLGAGAFFCVLSMAGQSDLEIAEANQAHYCEMVKAGAWPKDTSKEACK